MTEGARLSGPLPVVPSPEADELISSWLCRVANFYERPVQRLFREYGVVQRQLSFTEIDLGKPRSALRAPATLLGINPEDLAARCLSAVYPRPTKVIAMARSHDELWYAACPVCQEMQRLIHGFSWLRRAWVVAFRTVCPIHNVPLVAARPGEIANPIWSGFQSRHGSAAVGVYRATCQPAGMSCSIPGDYAVSIEGHPSRIYQHVATVENAILATTAGARPRLDDALRRRVRTVTDLIWAFTRADACEPDRLVYEALASDRLDNPWFMSRRRKKGPFKFANMVLRERHALMLTAIVHSGEDDIKQAFCRWPMTWEQILATLRRRLSEADAAELRKRQLL